MQPLCQLRGLIFDALARGLDLCHVVAGKPREAALSVFAFQIVFAHFLNQGGSAHIE